MANRNLLIDKSGKHCVTKETLDDQEVRRRQVATAMKDPAHLKMWLREVYQGWLVMKTDDLIDALDFPEDVQRLSAIVHCYGEYRRTQDSGRREIQEDPVTGRQIELVIYKDEALEVEELDRLIRYHTGLMYAKNPDWSLDDKPL